MNAATDSNACIVKQDINFSESAYDFLHGPLYALFVRYVTLHRQRMATQRSYVFGYGIKFFFSPGEERHIRAAFSICFCCQRTVST